MDYQCSLCLGHFSSLLPPQAWSWMMSCTLGFVLKGNGWEVIPERCWGLRTLLDFCSGMESSGWSVGWREVKGSCLKVGSVISFLFEPFGIFVDVQLTDKGLSINYGGKLPSLWCPSWVCKQEVKHMMPTIKALLVSSESFPSYVSIRLGV